MTDKPWWYPTRVGEDTIDRLRADFPEFDGLGDMGLLRRFGYETRKYEQPALWDHIGDAETDYNPVADAFLSAEKVVDAARQLMDAIDFRGEEICPHGISTRSSSGAWFCDDCCGQLRDALEEYDNE